MNDNNKRMIGDYEVIHAISAGPLEIALGCNLDADPGERYICAYCTGTGFLTQYSGVLASDDYAEMLQLFGNRIAEQAERLKVELAQPEKTASRISRSSVRDSSPSHMRTT